MRATSAFLEIEAAPWVSAGDRWCDRLFGIDMAAPPRSITHSSSDMDVHLAGAALSMGLASARVVGRSSAQRALASISLPLQQSRALLLPARLGGICARLTFEFGRTHLIPLSLAAVTLTASVLLQLPALFHVVASLTLVLVAVLVHELGHACTYRIMSGRDGSAVFVINRKSPRLVWPLMSRHKDLLTVVAGPLAPTLMPLALLAVPHSLPEVLVSTVVALAHLVILALPTGDGAQLRSVLQD